MKTFSTTALLTPPVSTVKNKGFSLIELMITLVIIGVLAAFALPSYTKYTMRAARAEGQQHAMAIIAAQERFYLERAAYTSKLKDDLGYSVEKPLSETGYFEASAAACPGTSLGQCVRITLAPKKPLTVDLIKALGNEAIWLQSNGLRSDSWSKAIN